MTIQETILCVMRAVGHIDKGQRNTFDKYDFRGIDDLYNVLGPAFAEHGMFIVPEVHSCDIDSFTTTNGATQQRAVVRVSYHFHAEDGSALSAVSVGEGADRGDKAVNKAMTSAFKTVLFQTLCIPTKEQSDSEFHSPEHDKGDNPTPPKPAPAPINPELEVANEIKAEAIKQAALFGMEPINGKFVLIDALRRIGLDDTDASNYPGMLVTALQREPAARASLIAAIGLWEPPDDDGFVKDEA